MENLITNGRTCMHQRRKIWPSHPLIDLNSERLWVLHAENHNSVYYWKNICFIKMNNFFLIKPQTHWIYQNMIKFATNYVFPSLIIVIKHTNLLIEYEIPVASYEIPDQRSSYWIPWNVYYRWHGVLFPNFLGFYRIRQIPL